MPRPERPIDPLAGPRERFAYDLRQLRVKAGKPSYKRISELAHYSCTALSEAAGGRVFPSWEVTRAFVLACEGDEEEWRRRWAEVERALDGGASPSTAENSTVVRRPDVRWILVAVIVMLAATSVCLGVLLLARPATVIHSNFLGQVDLAGYCRAQGYSDVSLDGKTAADWHCSRSPDVKDSLSVIEACRWQYRRVTAIARYDDPRDPDSWQCWDNVVILGRIHVEDYCRARGYASARPESGNLALWDCATENGITVPINDDSACRWEYGARVLVANPGPFHSPWEHWDCWG